MKPKVVCIRTGYKYGPEYVDKLHAGLKRSSTVDFDFYCIDSGPFEGWWNKLTLFNSENRIIYLDLDTVITGNVDFLFEYDGPFCIMKNPFSDGYNSSVMST